MKHSSLLLPLAGILLLAFLTAGCAFNTNPRFDVDPVTEKPTMVKRYPKYPAWQELFFWRTKEYRKNTKELSYLLSDEQEDLISRYGQPDYIRRTFFSTRGDRVHEWLFWDDQRVAQFVQGQVVWEGQLTDLEKVLLLYGRPGTFKMTRTKTLDTSKIFIRYPRWFGMRIHSFYLVNDRMIMGKDLF